MQTSLFLTVFTTVFLAELGDKTQLATFLYASDAANPRTTVFLASAAALVLSSLIGVVAGSFVAEHVDERLLARLAGAAFVAVGLWTIARA